jgi:hypothetical protein
MSNANSVCYTYRSVCYTYRFCSHCLIFFSITLIHFQYLLFVVTKMYLLQVAQVIIQGVNGKVTMDTIIHFNMTLEPIATEQSCITHRPFVANRTNLDHQPCSNL